MSIVVGEDPGGPEIWGYQHTYGSILDVFVHRIVDGTTERKERQFAVYLHKPGEHLPELWWETDLVDKSEEIAGLVGILRVVRGTTGRSHASMEAFVGGKHLKATIPPSLPFNIEDMAESKRAITNVFLSPRARIFAGAIVVGTAASGAYKRLLDERRQWAE
ncbi:hypothetical protein IPL85_05195 [Candidatus Saccharibacteria bacterium]|nr:MAG: hypothetical protein IPL85_05195 [Candidatus Saccharibacteria bacterium]